jgi:sortase A
LKQEKSKKTDIKKIILAIASAVAIIILILLYFFSLCVKPASTKQALSTIKNNKISISTSKISKFELIITKLGISVPIIPNVDGSDKDGYFKALINGVAHYRGTSLPGNGSNTFIFGHSSSPEEMNGNFDKVFSKLNDLVLGDEIIINFNEKVFTYSVFDKKTVKPGNISVLNPTDKEQITLMTCWPIGNNTERLIILAR